MEDYWGGPSEEEKAACRSAVGETVERLLEIQRRQREDPGYEGALLTAWVRSDLLERHGADAGLKLVSVLLAQIADLAPAHARDDAGNVVLDRIVRHRRTEEEITREVLDHLGRSGAEVPAPADLKA